MAIKQIMGNDKSITQDMVHTFLANLAYTSFSDRVKEQDPDGLMSSIAEYRNQYKLQFSQEKFMAILISSRMIRLLTSGNTAFAYPYTYYFFVAKFFQRNVNSSKYERTLRLQLVDIGDRLHIDEYAYIILFLIYLSKDEKVIDMIVRKSRSLFRDELACDLDTDVKWMTTSFDVRKELPIGNNRPDANREIILAQMDQDGSDDTIADGEGDAEARDGLPEEVREIIMALRHIQISGQIIRSFPGTLEGDVKDRIAQECAMLGFRTLGFALRAIGQGKKGFTKAVINLFKKEGIPTTREVVRAAAEDYLTFYGIMVAYSMLSSVSIAMGSQHLSKTYEAIGDSRASLTFDLLKLKLSLDHQRKFPGEGISKLFKDLSIKRKKPIAAAILRLMVWEHVFLFPIEFEELERVSTVLGIERNRTRALLPSEGGR